MIGTLVQAALCQPQLTTHASVTSDCCTADLARLTVSALVKPTNTERVTSVWVLGVTVNDTLTAADHLTILLSSCSSLLYAMQVLHSHCNIATRHIPGNSHLAHLVRSDSLVGMSSATDRAQLDSLLHCRKQFGYCSNDVPTVTELFNSADDDFFYSVNFARTQ